MTRAARLAVIGTFTLVLTGFLACCVNFTRAVDFSLSSWAGVTTLDLYVDRLGVRNFNPHASNSDSYSFILPAGQAHVAPAQIRAYFANYQQQVPAFGESGGIDLKIDASGCEIRVNLTTTDGLAFAGNGVHREIRCGLDKI